MDKTGQKGQEGNNNKEMLELCKQYHYHLMHFETTDGHLIEGIIENMDEEQVHLLVPSGEMEVQEARQFASYGGAGGYAQPFGYGPSYGGVPYGGYPYGYPRRFRRFRRYRLPYYLLGRLFFPYFY